MVEQTSLMSGWSSDLALSTRRIASQTTTLPNFGGVDFEVRRCRENVARLVSRLHRHRLKAMAEANANIRPK